jgi:outer membrane lipoprotein-sorting protein
MVLRLSKVDLAKPLNPRLFEYAVPPGAEVKDLDKGEGGKAGMME